MYNLYWALLGPTFATNDFEMRPISVLPYPCIVSRCSLPI